MSITELLGFLHQTLLDILASGYVPFMIVVSLVAIIMQRAHRASSTKFSMYDLVSNSVTEKASVEAIGMLMAMLSVTLWFMDMAAMHKATWSDAVAYGGLMGLAKAVNKAVDMKGQMLNQPAEEVKDQEQH